MSLICEGDSRLTSNMHASNESHRPLRMCATHSSGERAKFTSPSSTTTSSSTLPLTSSVPFVLGCLDEGKGWLTSPSSSLAFVSLSSWAILSRMSSKTFHSSLRLTSLFPYSVLASSRTRVLGIGRSASEFSALILWFPSAKFSAENSVKFFIDGLEA